MPPTSEVPIPDAILRSLRQRQDLARVQPVVEISPAFVNELVRLGGPDAMRLVDIFAANTDSDVWALTNARSRPERLYAVVSGDCGGKDAVMELSAILNPYRQLNSLGNTQADLDIGSRRFGISDLTISALCKQPNAYQRSAVTGGFEIALRTSFETHDGIGVYVPEDNIQYRIRLGQIASQAVMPLT